MKGFVITAWTCAYSYLCKIQSYLQSIIYLIVHPPPKKKKKTSIDTKVKLLKTNTDRTKSLRYVVMIVFFFLNKAVFTGCLCDLQSLHMSYRLYTVTRTLSILCAAANCCFRIWQSHSPPCTVSSLVPFLMNEWVIREGAGRLMSWNMPSHMAGE